MSPKSWLMDKAFSWLWAIRYPPVEFSTGKGALLAYGTECFWWGLNIYVWKRTIVVTPLWVKLQPAIIFRGVEYEVNKCLSLLEYCVAQRRISGARLLPERQRMGSEMYQLHRIESSWWRCLCYVPGWLLHLCPWALSLTNHMPPFPLLFAAITHDVDMAP